MPLQNKSIGAVITQVISSVMGGDSPLTIRFISAWAGLKNCGNLLQNKMQVGDDGGTLIGFTSLDGPIPHGSVNPDSIGGVKIYRLSVDTSNNLVELKMGITGTEQIAGINNVSFNFQEFGSITLAWNSNVNLVDGYSISQSDQSAIDFTNYMARINKLNTSYTAVLS